VYILIDRSITLGFEPARTALLSWPISYFTVEKNAKSNQCNMHAVRGDTVHCSAWFDSGETGMH